MKATGITGEDFLKRVYAIPDVWMDKDGLRTLWGEPEEVTPRTVKAVADSLGVTVGNMTDCIATVREAVERCAGADRVLIDRLTMVMAHRGIKPTGSEPATDETDAQVSAGRFHIQIETSCLDAWSDLGSFSILEIANEGQEGEEWIFHTATYSTAELVVHELDKLMQKENES